MQEKQDRKFEMLKGEVQGAREGWTDQQISMDKESIKCRSHLLLLFFIAMFVMIIVTGVKFVNQPAPHVHKPQPGKLINTRKGVARPKVTALPIQKLLKIGPPIETACVTPIEYGSKEPNTDWACTFVTNMQYSMSPGFGGCDGDVSYAGTHAAELKVHKDDGGKEFVTIH